MQKQLGYNFEIKPPAHSLVYVTLDNKEFTDESEYLLYMLSDEYLTNTEKMRQNLEVYQKEPLLEKF